MTKQDYEVIADALRELWADVEPVAEKLAIVFKRDNPRFNRACFMERALGYVPEPSLDYTLEEAKAR